MLRAGLVQLNASDDPGTNLIETRHLIEQAVSDGAQFVLTPEVTNCISMSRSHQRSVLHLEDKDPTLAALRESAARQKIWLLIGSLGLKTNDADGRFANRSFMIGPDGQIVARYDKIHMFDVDVSATETFRESDGYRPGGEAVIAQTDFAKVGMTICYDIRFPHLYRDLAHAGAQILTVPAAFSPVTGAAHWETLLRARAIENGCFVLAPAQTGSHKTADGTSRKTHGHALAIDPWGKILADAGTDRGVTLVDLDLDAINKARQRVPSITHDRRYTAPHGNDD